MPEVGLSTAASARPPIVRFGNRATGYATAMPAECKDRALEEVISNSSWGRLPVGANLTP